MAEAHNHDQVDWMKVPPEVVRKVKEMEDDEQEGSAHVMGTRARWTCVRCWWPQCRIAYTFDQLREHFIERSVTIHHVLLRPRTQLLVVAATLSSFFTASGTGVHATLQSLCIHP